MVSIDDLIAALDRNIGIVKSQTAGLTHADSVLQPPFRGNCLNWVLGHVAQSRNEMGQRLGLPAILSQAETKRYGYGSEPVLADGDDLIPLERLLALLASSQETIAGALGQMTAKDLADEVESFMGKTTLGQLLFFLYFHETYHIGQTELLRQLAGTDDQVI